MAITTNHVYFSHNKSIMHFYSSWVKIGMRRGATMLPVGELMTSQGAQHDKNRLSFIFKVSIDRMRQIFGVIISHIEIKLLSVLIIDI